MKKQVMILSLISFLSCIAGEVLTQKTIFVRPNEIDEAVDIIMVKDIDRLPTEFDKTFERSTASFARTYTWIEYHTNNNMFTVWPKFETLLTMYADDYFNNNIWVWGDKPESMIRESNRGAIEWTPNTIDSKIRIDGHIAHIKLTSDMPNLKEYQMKEIPSNDWQKIDDNFKVDLTDKSNEFVFRTVNLANIVGPNIKL